MYALKFFFLIAFAFFATSCATKQTQEDTYPPFEPGKEAIATPVPQDPFAVPPGEPTQKPERLGLTLVVGGAGVASFATVGVLKRFREEGIVVDTVIASGWPALFAVGYAQLKSVHDLEWFAMRLTSDDFKFSEGFFRGKEMRLSKLIEKSLPAGNLQDFKRHVLIATGTTGDVDPFIYDNGDWKTAVLQTINVPGIYRGFSAKTDLRPLRPIAVDEALRKGADAVVAISMYDDYLKALVSGGEKDLETRKEFSAEFKKNLHQELSLTPHARRISINQAPDQFSAKRTAIQAGYRAAIEIAKALRSAD